MKLDLFQAVTVTMSLRRPRTLLPPRRMFEEEISRVPPVGHSGTEATGTGLNAA